MAKPKSDIRTAKIRLTVPEQSAPGERRKPNYVCRDQVLADLRRNKSLVREHYGIEYEVEKEDDNVIVVEIPLPGDDLLYSDAFRSKLFAGIKRHFEAEYDIPNPNGTQPQRRAAPDSNLLIQLSRYQALGEPPEIEEKLSRLQADIKEAKERGAALEARIDTLKGENGRLQHERPLPDSLTLADLAVLFSRRLFAHDYAKCCEHYEAGFPGGMDDDIRRALELDLKRFIVTPELVEQCSAEQAGIDLNQDIEAILAEAEERAKPFSESQYHKDNYLAWLGAEYVLDAVRAGRGADIAADVIEGARQRKAEFQEAANAWEEKRGLAAVVSTTLTERREIYELAKELSPEQRLDITVPVVLVSRTTPQSRTLYFVLPTTRKTEQENLTRALRWDISHALHEVLGDRPGAQLGVQAAQGSKLIGACLPHLDPPAEEAATKLTMYYDNPRPVEDLVTSLKKKYSSTSLSKIGVGISVHYYGEL